MPSSFIQIGGKPIGSNYPAFIIAEAGVNHDGNLDTALALIDAAADAGADAVKFQTFVANSLASEFSPKAAYQIDATGEEENQLEMLHRLELDEAAHQILISHCRSRNIIFLSSPFDPQCADLLARLKVPAIKLPSGEINNPFLLKHVGKMGKPIILSTGMANLDEVERALGWLNEVETNEIILLHCVSNYPANPADCNLLAMATMAAAFDVLVGYSDHTLGTEIPLAAVVLGACLIEKHLTLDCSRSGPDHAASMEPGPFSDMIKGIRKVESAFGHGRKEPATSEAAIAAVARRSIFAAERIPAGSVISAEMLTVRRPGTGLEPAMADKIIGRRAIKEIENGSILSESMLT
jgi:N,N'-diacetyllegionaminate synthase